MTATTAPAQQSAFRGPYGLTEEQELFKQTVHEFADREIVPVAHDLDEKEEYPRATVAKMAELGLLGLLVPEEYGGADASTLDYVLAMEEISWGDASHSVVVSVNNSLVCEPILRFGTSEQKERFLPAAADSALRQWRAAGKAAVLITGRGTSGAPGPRASSLASATTGSRGPGGPPTQ